MTMTHVTGVEPAQHRVVSLPPSSRSRIALWLTAAAAVGRFELQVCLECAAVQYPPREACFRCLSLRLDWKVQSGEGELICETTLMHSNETYFQKRLPWRLGMVRLDCGPTVIVHLHSQAALAPSRVCVTAALDKAGQGVLVASPKEVSMADDMRLNEMTCNPLHRKTLVTDGTTKAGAALVRGLVAAGAEVVWVGSTDLYAPGLETFESLKQVRVLPLDLTQCNSVKAAAEVAGQVDIVINNSEHRRPHGPSPAPVDRFDVEAARAEMDISYFGLLRLAQEFGPIMRARAADGQSGAIAWVNVLSIYGLTSLPMHGTYCASKAAAYSLSQCLRAQMRPAGIRVINVFTGPVEGEWSPLMPPKLEVDVLAEAIVKALRGSVEDVYPGHAAQEFWSRWRDNPKVLEREIAESR